MWNIKIKKHRLVITGYYGMSNFGDDIFGAVSAWGADKFWSEDFSILSPRISGVNAEFSVPDWYSKNIYASTNILGKISRLSFALKEVYHSKQMIFSGGSVFTSENTGVMKVIEKISKKSGLGLAGMGVSLGPFSNNQDAMKVKSFIERFDYLSVRDNASYEIANSFNLDFPVIMAGDLAGGLKHAYSNLYDKNQNKSQKVSIGVSLCNYESIVGKDSEIEKARNLALIKGILHSAKLNNAEVNIFSLNNHPIYGDDKLSSELSDALSEVNVKHLIVRNNDYQIKDIWAKISQCRVFISVRLHGAIVAYLNDVPFALIEYHKKCAEFLDDIGQDCELRLGRELTDPFMVSSVIDKLLSTAKPTKMTSSSYSDRSLQHFIAAPWFQNKDLLK